jgi:hypothetical protein
MPEDNPRVQPQRILETTMSNPSFDTSRQTWAREIAGGGLWLHGFNPPHEWTQVLNPSEEFEVNPVSISGTAVLPPENGPTGISSVDCPFTHPFGFDWNCYIAPDPDSPYTSLLAPSNTGYDPLTGKTDPDFTAANIHANSLGLTLRNGVLGLETDCNLIPQEYRARDGDRVAVFGRWIVDCGHDDYHTEIHPPLIFVRAWSTPDNKRTLSHVITRPYLVGQQFEHGALFEHLVFEVAQILPQPPPSFRVESHPQILPKPFRGFQLFTYLLRPPTPRPAPDVPLFVSYSFTKRSGRGIGIQVMQHDADTVEVAIAMNDAAYTPPPLPHNAGQNITLERLYQLQPEAADIYRDTIFGSALINPAAAAILLLGIPTDLYDAPQASSALDGLNEVVTTADRLPNPTPASEDDAQPFPLYGWITVEWGPPPRHIGIDGPTRTDADPAAQPLTFSLHPADLTGLRPVSTSWNITNPGTVRVEQAGAEQFVVTFLSNPPSGQTGWLITAQVTDDNGIIHAAGPHGVLFERQ